MTAHASMERYNFQQRKEIFNKQHYFSQLATRNAAGNMATENTMK
jgi:hypothetical protein